MVLVARKSRTAVERWVYTDVGKFSGLIETMDESIKFPIWTEKKGEMEEVIIAGPTCDSADIMYENYKYGLPLNLASGDRLYWLSTGAYTTSLQRGGVQRLPAAEGLLHLSPGAAGPRRIPLRRDLSFLRRRNLRSQYRSRR